MLTEMLALCQAMKLLKTSLGDIQVEIIEHSSIHGVNLGERAARQARGLQVGFPYDTLLSLFNAMYVLFDILPAHPVLYVPALACKKTTSIDVNGRGIAYRLGMLAGAR